MWQQWQQIAKNSKNCAQNAEFSLVSAEIFALFQQKCHLFRQKCRLSTQKCHLSNEKVPRHLFRFILDALHDYQYWKTSFSTMENVVLSLRKRCFQLLITNGNCLFPLCNSAYDIIVINAMFCLFHAGFQGAKTISYGYREAAGSIPRLLEIMITAIHRFCL